MTLSNNQINDLPEISFIAGNETELNFTIYTSDGNFANLTGATVTWKLAPYGSSVSVLTKNGVVDATPSSGKFVVTLEYADTSLLSGKYIQQYATANSSNTYLPSQGIVNIIPRIS